MVKVYVKKEGAEADTPFWPGDTVELLRLVAEEFGAAGRLKTTDGDVIGTAFPLEEGVTLTWHPSTGGLVTAGLSAAGAPGKPLVVTFKKGKAAKDGTFDTLPQYQQLSDEAEALFPELKAEDFDLKAGKVVLSSQNWPRIAARKSTLTLKVASICKPFSHFKQDEAFEVLDTAIAHAEDAARGAQISLAEYNPASQAHQSIRDSLGFRTHADIVAHAGKELALRCCMSDPHAHDKEASKRELISPVIFAAAALIGVVRVEAEYSVRGRLGRGMIDYVILCDDFTIVVLEGKLHATLTEHLGQLAAEMRSAREQYKRVYLRKRKLDDEGSFKKVPSFGILSNGTRYIFYKYTPEDRSLVKLGLYAHLKLHIHAEEAIDQVLPIIRCLVKIIQEQLESMDSFKRARSG